MITIDPPSTPSIPALSKPGLTRFLNRARTAVGLEGQVDVRLTSDAELKSLVERAKGLLSGVSAKDLKTAAELRSQVRAGMDDIAAQLDTLIVRKGARKFRLED